MMPGGRSNRALRVLVAIKNFEGAAEGELPLVKIGDEIAIRGQPSAGWCEGECKGEIGWFPIDTVEGLIITREESKSVDVSSVGLQNSHAIGAKLKTRVPKTAPKSSHRTSKIIKEMDKQNTQHVISSFLNGRRIAVPEIDTLRTESGLNDDTERTESEEEEEEEVSTENEAIALFESKPSKSIKMLIENGRLNGSVESVASFLFRNDNLSGKSVGEYLGEPDAFNVEVLETFIGLMDVSKVEFDDALRNLMLLFRLPGESQKIERVMEAFAKVYYQKHPAPEKRAVYKSPDSLFGLAYAIMMLNTDLHSPNVKKKMKPADFVHRVDEVTVDSGAFPQKYLHELYNRIEAEEVRTSDGVYAKAVKRGFLFAVKKTGLRKKYLKLWWVLDLKSSCLLAFKDNNEKMKVFEYKLSELSLRRQKPNMDKNGRFNIQLKHKDQDFRLYVSTQRLWVDWLAILTEVLPKRKK